MLSEHESADRGVSGTPWGSFTPQPMSRLIQHLATLAEATRRSPAPGVVGVGEWPGLPDPVRQGRPDDCVHFRSALPDPRAHFGVVACSITRVDVDAANDRLIVEDRIGESLGASRSLGRVSRGLRGCAPATSALARIRPGIQALTVCVEYSTSTPRDPVRCVPEPEAPAGTLGPRTRWVLRRRRG